MTGKEHSVWVGGTQESPGKGQDVRTGGKDRKQSMPSTISLRCKLAENKDLSAFFTTLSPSQAQGRHTVGTSIRYAYIHNSKKYILQMNFCYPIHFNIRRCLYGENSWNISSRKVMARVLDSKSAINKLLSQYHQWIIKTMALKNGFALPELWFVICLVDF